MRLRLTFAAVILALTLISSAHAQVAIYGTFSAVRLSGVATGISLTPNGFETNTDTYFANGFGGGVTLNFIHLGPASLGLDLRGSSKPGTPGADTAFGGIKLGVHPPHTRFKPYVQFSAGYLDSRTAFRGTDPPGSNVTNKYAAYEVLGGLDYSVQHFIDVRLVEIGAGKAFDTGADITGKTYNPTMLTINTGVVFHF